MIFEPGHSIPYKIACAPNEDSDQPVRPCLIRIFIYLRYMDYFSLSQIMLATFVFFHL